MFTSNAPLRAARVAVLLAFAMTLGVARRVPAATAFTTLSTFDAAPSSYPPINAHGAHPKAALVLGPDGNFYGTTFDGGANGSGTVFQVSPAGALITLYSFSALSASGTNSDGANPAAALAVGADGDLYGTASAGGMNGTGAIFKITPAGTFTTLHDFSALAAAAPYADSDGAYPDANLTVGTDGDFYGTTSGGGMNGTGTIFKITPAGTLATLYSFSATAATAPYGNPDGAYPQAALAAGNDGDFYGVALEGGPNGSGTIFKITPAGTLTTLHGFAPLSASLTNSDGGLTSATLVLGSDDDFYGTTKYGGMNGNGTVFQMTPRGALTTLHTFSALTSATNSDGAHPYAALVSDPDGDFDGTAFSGGADGSGSVFHITPGGTLTTLYTFSATAASSPYGNPNGAGPNDLVLGSDGALYGTTVDGGANGTGTVYKLGGSASGSAGTWSATGVSAAGDGTARILWNRSDGAAGLWILNVADAQTKTGPVYGPYAGWTAKTVGVAGDGTSRVLWTNASGAAGVWSFDATGSETLIGPTYGPYAGWTAKAVGVASDGTSRVLWTNASGATGIWSLGTDDAKTLVGPVYGPYAGWTATSIGVASDGTSRIMWTNADGAAGVWSLGVNDAETIIGPAYGSFAGWSATSIGVAGDGAARVLWTSASGGGWVWSFDGNGNETALGQLYGPYSGWTASALATATDGTSRVLWNRADRAAGIWTFDASDLESVIGTTYGPY